MPESKKSTKSTDARLKAKYGNTLIIEKLPGYFLIICLAAAFSFLIYILWPFITSIFLAGVLTVAFYSVYKIVLRFFRGWSRTASMVTCLLVVLVVIVPLSVFVLLLATEAYDTYLLIQDNIGSGVFDKYLQWDDGGYFFDLKRRIQPVIDLDSIDMKKTIINMAQSLSTFLVSQTASFLKGLSNIIMKLIVMIFALFYFFKDGHKLIDKIGSLSPLPTVYETELFQKIASMVKAVVFGVFFTSIIQGIVGGVGFGIIGVSNPIFWGTAIAFFSLVPVVGTALVWVPASIVLAIMGEYGSAIFLFLWGLLAVGSVDNFVRPYLIGGKAKTYPLMTLLVVLGGVLTMGLKGVIIGPLVLMILMSFLHIYESEYGKVLKK
ncbi:AI-2E family transporter [Candidatus Peregrinibacteria bacterium]|nr:AI-2E family transporter [Candidatus Peregrinibacteria bacterium]